MSARNNKIWAKAIQQHGINAMTKIMIYGISMALLSSLAMATRASAEGNGYLDEGIRRFNQGQYEVALFQLKKAATVAHNDPLVHYYLASTLARLNEVEPAIQEFDLAYKLSPPVSQVSQYARTALATYGMSPYGSAPQPASSSSNNPDSRNVNDTLSTISKQAEEVKQREEKDAQQRASEVISAGNRNAQAAVQSANDQANAMANTYSTGWGYAPNYYRPYAFGSGYGYYRGVPYQVTIPAYSPAQIQAVRDEGAAKASDIKQTAADSAQREIEGSKEKIDSLQESAQGLASQMETQSSLKDSVKLVPTGTSLYVRNYASATTPSDQDEPTLPMMSSPGKMKVLNPAMKSARKDNQ